jgi:hypothetical protein
MPFGSPHLDESVGNKIGFLDVLDVATSAAPGQRAVVWLRPRWRFRARSLSAPR